MQNTKKNIYITPLEPFTSTKEYTSKRYNLLPSNCLGHQDDMYQGFDLPDTNVGQHANQSLEVYLYNIRHPVPNLDTKFCSPDLSFLDNSRASDH